MTDFPVPEVQQVWHVPNPYEGEECHLCGGEIAKGELVNINKAGSFSHARCSDD